MINFFGREIPLYGVCWLLGIVLAGIVACFLLKRAKMDHFDLACSAVFALFGGIIGSKLMFITVSLKTILALKLSFFEVLQGGFVFYGGLIGGFIGLMIYSKIFKIKSSVVMDIYAVVLPLGHACGRVGCYLGGCCYGMEYHGPFSVTYSDEVLNYGTPVGVPLFPVQLLESALLLVMFALLIVLYFKTHRAGMCSAVYLYTYAVTRFVLEYFRGDKERGSFLALSTSQIISLLIVIAVTVVIAVNRKRQKAAE